jgi:hypothetical protein
MADSAKQLEACKAAAEVCEIGRGKSLDQSGIPNVAMR